MTSRVEAGSRRGRARRRAALAAVRLGERALPELQSAAPGLERGVTIATVQDWTPTRILAANLSLAAALAAIILLVADHLDLLSQPALAVIFALLTTSLIRRGSGLRRRGLELLGRSVTAWAALTGSLVVVTTAASLGVATFVPELLALSGAWLVVLAVWKRLPSVMAIATFLVGPIVWGAVVWGRTLVGAVAIVLAAYVFSRSGQVHRVVFLSCALHAILLVVVTTHLLTRPGPTVSGTDLLVAAGLVTALVAAGVSESWYPDWVVYGRLLRRMGVVAGLALAVLASQPRAVRAVVDSTRERTLAWDTAALVILMVLVWVAIANRPVQPGGTGVVALWTAVLVVMLGALTETISVGLTQAIGIAVTIGWGTWALHRGLLHQRPVSAAGGFALVVASIVPPAVAAGTTWVVLALAGVVALGGALVSTTPGPDPR